MGGSFNTMAGLVTMELAKVVPKQYQNQCLGFYSALTMSVANITTAITQILIGYVANKGIFKQYFRLIDDFHDIFSFGRIKPH